VPRSCFLWLSCALLALGAVGATPAGSVAATTPATTPATTAPTPVESEPTVSVNEFLPEDRSIGECISAVPRPGCGSDARGGWRQYVVALVLVAGLVFVGWRIVAGLRRPRKPVPG
jgi:hypothetical protein